MKHSIWILMLALAIMLGAAIFESSLPPVLCWSAIAIAIALILVWKFSFRAHFAQSEMLTLDEVNVAAVKVVAIGYLAFIPLFIGALWCSWYFQLGLPSFLFLVCIWLVRHDVYAWMLMQKRVERQ